MHRSALTTIEYEGEDDHDHTTFDDGGYETWFVARLICVIRQSRTYMSF